MRHVLTLSLLLALTPSLEAQGMPPAAVKTGTVRKELVSEVVSGVATVEPWLRTVLGAEVASVVKSYPLREGDAVTAGETVVCELKQTDLLIDLAEAEALLSRAEAEAETTVATTRDTMDENRALKDRAEQDLDRATDLFEKKVINKAELDRAESDAIAARFRFLRAEKAHELARAGSDPATKAREAEVRRAKARLDRVKDRIGKTRIVSPVTGRVVRRMTEVGGWVNPGSPIIEVISLDPVLVRIGVNERDIAKIQVGDEAEIRVTTYGERAFAGKVRHLVPEADPKSRAFPVLIEIPNPKGLLLAGMYARAEIRSGRNRYSLTIPKDALVTGRRRGTVVYTIVDGKAVPVPVRTGISVGDRVVVEGEGLKDGLVVITTGNEKIMPGQQVLPERANGGGEGRR